MDTRGPDILFIESIRAECIVGTHEAERHRRQELLIDLEMTVDAGRAARNDDLDEALDYEAVTRLVAQEVGRSHFRLIESVAEHVAALLLRGFDLQEVAVTVRKPAAVAAADSVGIRIVRGKPA